MAAVDPFRPRRDDHTPTVRIGLSLPYFSCAIIAPAVYRDSLASGERERARYCRRQVIAAKDGAKFLAITPRGTPERRSQKEEMAQWVLVWLENPELFPAWVDARKKAISNLG